MIINSVDGITVLYAEGTNKITNSERSFFSNFIYLGSNDNTENYTEVPKALWKNFVDDDSTDIDILNECSDYLTDNKGKEKTIVASTDGNINVITRTNRYPLPEEEIFERETLSRSKDARDRFLSGVVDINLYEDGSYYSVGIKGSGMNTKIIRAPHLYKVDVVSGENIIENILSTMSATFVKYKSFTVLPYPVKYLNEYILMIESLL